MKFICKTFKTISWLKFIQSLAEEINEDYIKKSIETERKSEENLATET